MGTKHTAEQVRDAVRQARNSAIDTTWGCWKSVCEHSDAYAALLDAQPVDDATLQVALEWLNEQSPQSSRYAGVIIDAYLAYRAEVERLKAAVAELESQIQCLREQLFVYMRRR